VLYITQPSQDSKIRKRKRCCYLLACKCAKMCKNSMWGICTSRSKIKGLYTDAVIRLCVFRLSVSYILCFSRSPQIDCIIIHNLYCFTTICSSCQKSHKTNVDREENAWLRSESRSPECPEELTHAEVLGNMAIKWR
jgi:hypothetical protein